jgi:hypothetical protein
MNGGGAQETMKDALIVEKRRYRDSQKEANFLVSLIAISF